MSRLRILLAGDVMTGRGIDQVLPHPCDPWLCEECVRDARDYVRLAERASGTIAAPVAPAYVWGDALATLHRDDIDLRIVNLETAVTCSDAAWPGKGINYRMHPANVDCLAQARLDCCALANNHVLDWGHAGLHETLSTLRAAGLRTAGAGLDDGQAWRAARLERPQGARVLVLSVAAASSGVPASWAAGPGTAGIARLPDLSQASLEKLHDAVARQRQPGDVVIVSIHWGGNWGLEVPSEHRDAAHALIEAGVADLVHGHSSHHPLPLEVHRGKLIIYGCGDLLNDYEGIGGHGSLRCDVGCLYVATLAGPGALEALDILPFQLCKFRLSHAQAPEREWLERVFDDGGRAFGTRLDPQPGGAWRLQWSG
jgi:poly-gamma-glutamate synthesis protein (capsule biosynthesis protein)